MAETINKEVLQKVANLARIKLTEEEIKKFTKQLQNVLDAFKALNEVKADVEPAFHPFEIKNVFREDNVEESFTIDETLGNTEHKEDKHFKGPRIV